MHKYRLYYLSDADDANWQQCATVEPVNIGDVMELSCGLFHVVCDINQQKTLPRLVLSKSSQ
ncbi:MAG: hypothetical protein OIF34_04910, partial [Porticoccaceae bacterium]|nr:hypothetical protein [Porticoccaceae bacterium]